MSVKELAALYDTMSQNEKNENKKQILYYNIRRKKNENNIDQEKSTTKNIGELPANVNINNLTTKEEKTEICSTSGTKNSFLEKYVHRLNPEIKFTKVSELLNKNEIDSNTLEDKENNLETKQQFDPILIRTDKENLNLKQRHNNQCKIEFYNNSNLQYEEKDYYLTPREQHIFINNKLIETTINTTVIEESNFEQNDTSTHLIPQNDLGIILKLPDSNNENKEKDSLIIDKPQKIASYVEIFPQPIYENLKIGTFNFELRDAKEKESIHLPSRYSHVNKLYKSKDGKQFEEILGTELIDSVEQKIENIISGKIPIKFNTNNDDSFWPTEASNESLNDLNSDEEEHLSELSNENIFSEDINTIIPLSQILSKCINLDKLNWSHIINKFQLNITNTISDTEKKLLEAKFQLILSEWIYYKAYKVFDSHYVSKTVIVLTRDEFNELYGNFNQVVKGTKELIDNIDDNWSHDILMYNLCLYVNKYLNKNFDIFVQYYANQIYTDTLLIDLFSNNQRSFKVIVEKLENDPIVENISLNQSLKLPIRNFFNLQNLIENILTFLSKGCDEYKIWQQILNKIISLQEKCKIEDKKTRKKFITQNILNKFIYPKNIKKYSNDSNALLLKSSNVQLLKLNSLDNYRKDDIHLFLFNNVLFITKKQNEQFSVINYFHKSSIKVYNDEYITQKENKYLNNYLNNIIYLSGIRSDRIEELMFYCYKKTDKIRWIDALDEKISENRKNSKVIKQIIAQQNYDTLENDEINYKVNDVIDVLQIYEDGYWFGTNTNEGETGWFRNIQLTTLLIADTEEDTPHTSTNQQQLTI